MLMKGHAAGDDSAVGHEVLTAAHESSEHAARAGRHGLGDATFEQLRAEVARLSRLSEAGDPFPVFLDMRRLRSRIYRLLDRPLWPRERAGLQFLLGWLNGLMGRTARRLGYPDAARELIEAGRAYADGIGSQELHRMLTAFLGPYPS